MAVVGHVDHTEATMSDLIPLLCLVVVVAVMLTIGACCISASCEGADDE